VIKHQNKEFKDKIVFPDNDKTKKVKIHI